MESLVKVRQLSGTLLVIAALVLSGCATTKKDGAPSEKRDVSKIPDAVPRIHNGEFKDSPYTLNGEVYTPMKSANGYSEEGIASWYGTKFHGKQTANGEVYDLYGMTAAHKTLPLPSYVKVTNKGNNRSVVLRVNDRGPFHGDRLIDLSYAAAKKLGYADVGGANVLIEGIEISAFAKGQTQGIREQVFVQMGALKNYHNAQMLRRQIAEVVSSKIKIIKGNEEPESIYRVRIGPIQTPEHLENLLGKLQEESFDTPYLVYETVSD